MAMNDADENENGAKPIAPLPTVNARISPRGGLDILSRAEIARLSDASSGGLHELLRRCTLAVLTTGSDSDDPRAAQQRYPDFDIQVHQQDRWAIVHYVRKLQSELPVAPPAPGDIRGCACPVASWSRGRVA